MRWLRNVLTLTPCGKLQVDHFAHRVDMLQWQPECTKARWFAWPFSFARLAVATMGALPPRPVRELLTLVAQGQGPALSLFWATRAASRAASVSSLVASIAATWRAWLARP